MASQDQENLLKADTLDYDNDTKVGAMTPHLNSQPPAPALPQREDPPGYSQGPYIGDPAQAYASSQAHAFPSGQAPPLYAPPNQDIRYGHGVHQNAPSGYTEYPQVSI